MMVFVCLGAWGFGFLVCLILVFVGLFGFLATCTCKSGEHMYVERYI